MDVQHTGPIQGLSGCTASAESRPGRIGPICLEAKQTGERSARKSACCVRRGGAGNVAWARWCDTRRRKSEPTGNTNFDLNRRASPRPYREVQVLKKSAASSKKSGKRVAIISYDEKPGIQAIATTAPDLPPVPGVHPAFARDFEYKRHGTLSLLAGIDLLTGKVHALVKDRHRSREFIEFLKLI